MVIVYWVVDQTLLKFTLVDALTLNGTYSVNDFVQSWAFK